MEFLLAFRCHSRWGFTFILPILIFLGLPATVENGTNRIAILVQNIFATARFKQFNVIPKGVTLITTIPTMIGFILGAQLAVDIDELLFKRILGVITILVLGLMLFELRQECLNPYLH